MKWTILEDTDKVARKVCQRIVSTASKAIADKGEFHVVLAGGSTPAAAYTMLAREKCDWAHWHIWFGDERCLPSGHPDRNSTMVERLLTGKVPIPVTQLHVIPAELGPTEAAKQYADLLANQPPFDLVLLGMGEDGHTASLFPGFPYQDGQSLVPVFDAPKPPPERVSLGPAMLSHCHHLIFIITGEGKSNAVAGWRKGEDLPVAMISALDTSEVIADREAMSQV